MLKLMLKLQQQLAGLISWLAVCGESTWISPLGFAALAVLSANHSRTLCTRGSHGGSARWRVNAALVNSFGDPE